MATKQNDAVSAVDNSDEDVFPSHELLLEATKFDEANVSHDVALKINPKVQKKPSFSSCESGVSCTRSPNQAKIYCAHVAKRLHMQIKDLGSWTLLTELCVLSSPDCQDKHKEIIFKDIADHFSANHESKHLTKKEQ